MYYHTCNYGDVLFKQDAAAGQNLAVDNETGWPQTWNTQGFLCCDKLWKCKFMALEKPGKLGDFFSYFVATL